MTVITISREPGSEGAAIGRQAAAKLNYPYVDKERIGQVLEEYGLVQFEGLLRSTPGFWARYDDANLRMVAMLNQVIRAMAQRGNMLIVGRGGFAVLEGFADVLHVRVKAPFELRLERLIEKDLRYHQMPLETARQALLESDRARQTFLQAFYNRRGDRIQDFHLVIDTSRIEPPLAAEWIVSAARSIDLRQPAPGSPLTRSIEVDDVLAFTVAAVMST
jgi:cytidylate kinase